jgi:hypothetical protein
VTRNGTHGLACVIGGVAEVPLRSAAGGAQDGLAPGDQVVKAGTRRSP